ncbi:MAG: hypothetical protein K0S93_56 [Nitrososphaeraceae archaeon]|jgi:hypothetical protein|nr:hypothetical protein [Nitrososphaeraceae archaeon]
MNNLNDLKNSLADLNAEMNLNIFNSDIDKSLCSICREIGQTTDKIVQYKRCEKHKNTHFCNLCRSLVTHSFICISCLSKDMI